MRRCTLVGLGIACLGLAGSMAPAGGKKDDPVPKKPDEPLIVLDAKGKEVKVMSWHFAAGTRRLPGLDGQEPKPPPASGGPEYLEFREEKSTTFQNGILTLVPVASLRKLDYDNDKKTVTAVVATAGGKDETLVGTTKFQGINRIVIEGESDLGDLGHASIKYQSGNPKSGLTGVRFPHPKPAPEIPKGSTAVIVADEKDKPKHEVAELTALYQQPDGSYRTLPQLMFKKTVKIDLAKIVSLRHVEAEDKQGAYDFEVALQSGDKHTLTLLTKVELDKGKSMTLTGLFGRVPVGYKLFPVHTIVEARMEQEK